MSGERPWWSFQENEKKGHNTFDRYRAINKVDLTDLIQIGCGIEEERRVKTLEVPSGIIGSLRC